MLDDDVQQGLLHIVVSILPCFVPSERHVADGGHIDGHFKVLLLEHNGEFERLFDLVEHVDVLARAHVEAEKSFEIPAFEAQHLVVQARVEKGHGIDLDTVAEDGHSLTQTQFELVGHKIHLGGLCNKRAGLLSLLVVVGLLKSRLGSRTGWFRIELIFGKTTLVVRFALPVRLVVLRSALVTFIVLASFRILLLAVPAFVVSRLGSVVVVAAITLISSFILAGVRIGTIVVVLPALRFATLVATSPFVVIAWFAVALVVVTTLVVVVLSHLQKLEFD